MEPETPRPQDVPGLRTAERHDFPRLSLSSPTRIILATLSSSALGMFLGLYQGGKMAQLRFRAEHAHKMPTTTTDWYFYHKSKNYHAAQGGLKEGLKMSGKLGLWTTIFFSLEHTLDVYRGTADLLNTVIAGLTVSGGFSLWSKSIPFFSQQGSGGFWPFFLFSPLT